MTSDVSTITCTKFRRPD